MRTLVVYCHPDPASFVAAAKERVVAGLRAGGHEVRLVDLYAEGFRPELDADERRAWSGQATPADRPPLDRGVCDHPAGDRLDRHADDLRWAEAIVLVYPTWWSGQPAMLKGWIDRVWRDGIAFEHGAGTRGRRALLTNVRRIAVVTTHGSSKFVNALEGESGKRIAFRAIRSTCHPRARTSWVAMYGLDRADHTRRTAWLDRVERRFSSF